LVLRVVVALSVGLAIVIGVVRIMMNHPIHWYIISGYVLVLAVTYFAPPEIVGLAYDSGGVTSSTVTVPLVAALGIGLASTLKNRNPIIDGFGLIAFASLTPMIFVQIYGIVAYTFGSTAPVAEHIFQSGAMLQTASASAAFASLPLSGYVARFVGTVGDVLPIILTILFFYFAVIRKPVDKPLTRIFGFTLVILGLYAFVVGLELGLFPIGESIATALAESGNNYLIYLFAFTIGFATTIAEPALTAIARKAETISGGSIRSFLLRMFVATGVGVGILLGTYRIIHGDSIVWYIMAGYVVVVLFTFFAPRTIIPIAYDSGGVTTSTVTVPIVAALGLGLASSIPGRDPLVDGFGLIAFASLFPMIAVLSYGIFETQNIRRHERSLKKVGSTTVDRILKRLQKEDAGSLKRTKKEIITITGVPGSGVTTITKKLAERLQYHCFSSGSIFRAVAETHNLSIDELTKQAEADPSIDQEIDEMVQELGIKESKLVIDSRLAYHWIHRSFKVYLTVPQELSVKRIYESIHNEGRDGERVASLEEVRANTLVRQQSKRERYQKLYGIDIENTRPFDLVLDTSDTPIDEAVETILSAYETWFSKKK